MEEKAVKILMVEDNINVLHLNRSVLERQGYTVLCAESLGQARDLLMKHPQADLAVLDILLPDGNGLEFAREVKQIAGCPVLMLTSKRSHSDIVEGLTGSADDYLTKPYRIEELSARIRALLIKRNETPVRVAAKGSLTLDIPSGRAFLHDGDLMLQPREFSVLLTLMQHENQRLSAGALYETAWNLPATGDVSAVKTTVSRLRKKLAGSGFCIEYERGGGYCFWKEDEAAGAGRQGEDHIH